MDYNQIINNLLIEGKKLYEDTIDFCLDLDHDKLHGYLFLEPHFPLFFIIHAIYVCIIIRKQNSLNRKEKKISPCRSFLAAAGILFFGRAIVAFLLNRRPPLLNRPFYIPIFAGIWLLCNFCPFDLFYKILSCKFFFFFLQLCYALIQVRELCHGVDIGIRGIQNNVGPIFNSFLLSSTEIIIWLAACGKDTRYFCTKALIRNAICASVYYVLVNFPDLFEAFFEVDKKEATIYILYLYFAIELINDLIYGISFQGTIDITLLTYFGKLFTFYGCTDGEGAKVAQEPKQEIKPESSQTKETVDEKKGQKSKPTKRRR